MHCLVEKSTQFLKKEDTEQLVKEKMSQALPIDPKNLQETMKIMKDKETMAQKMESGPLYLQQVSLSFLNKESALNYINIKRYNAPKFRKLREWVFTFTDAEPADIIASRILDLLIHK